ncbi:putative F-box protein At3g10240 [Solanum tuberosum]|uniref:putative F-box protein At3g10240 n=1 Tax=Solanum tuberosum TaxID=4113 RepID=UPI00073A41AA|nr:PREDICTED: putative F-box protein At3g10240 [Solanum tuberosum]
MKVYERRRKKKLVSVTNNSDLPEAIIEQILSCLPVKALLRFKSVSKDWNSIILDHHFIFLHSENSSLLIYNKSENDEFVVLDGCKGLLLEQSIVNNSRLYRIRNPEIGQLVQLPNPQNNPSLLMTLDFLPSKQVFKILSIYKDENSLNLGCEILTIGNESSCLWRLLELPTCQNVENVTNCHVFVTSEVAYCIWGIIDQTAAIKIDILDMENEIYITTATLPRGNFTSKLGFDNYIQWNEKVSFGKILNDELHVLVLDDYKTNKWIEEKRTVKMKNLKEEDEPIEILSVNDLELYFLLPEKKSFYRYNFTSGKVDIVLSDYDDSKILAVFHSSLYTLNGMQSI